MDAYNKELKRILTDKAMPAETAMRRSDIEATIAEISEALRGPMSNAERLSAVETRAMLRKQLQNAE